MMKMVDNKYYKWYNSLIDRARNRTIEGYVEEHHVVPRSLGGTDDESNLVKLTAREHVIAHMLLPRFAVTDRIDRLWYSLWCMINTNGVKVNSRLYEKFRSEAFTRRSKDSSWKANNATGARRRAQSKSWRQNHTKAMRKRNTMEWCKRMSLQWTEAYSRPEYRANRVLGMILGRKRSCNYPEKRRWYKPKPYNVPREGLMAILANEEKYGSAKADVALALLSY